MMRSTHSQVALRLRHSPTVMSVVKAILFALPRNHENHIDKYQENKQQIKLLKVFFFHFLLFYGHNDDQHQHHHHCDIDLDVVSQKSRQF